jgi:hypothetical protein
MKQAEVVIIESVRKLMFSFCWPCPPGAKDAGLCNEAPAGFAASEQPLLGRQAFEPGVQPVSEHSQRDMNNDALLPN